MGLEILYSSVANGPDMNYENKKSCNVVWQCDLRCAVLPQAVRCPMIA